MNRRLMLIGIGGAALVVLVFLAAYFSDFLSSRVLSRQGGRASVKQGEDIVLSITTSKTTPFVKIEICQEKKTLTNCKTLKDKAAGKQVAVRIPTTYPLGKAVVRILERDKAGKLTSKVQYARPVLVTKGASPSQNTDQGGGGGSGGGGGGNNSSNDSNPPPAVVNATLTGVCIDVSDFDVNISWTPSNTAVIKYRLVGQPNWMYPICGFGCNPYYDSNNSRVVTIFNGFNGTQDRLPFNTDFEFYFDPVYNSPPGTQPSQIYRFNSGPGPFGPSGQRRCVYP
jgi:hypothetical protein